MGKEEVELVTVAKPANKKSLLERYDIPIEHLSFEYINQCKEAKELERIVLILRSGEEGSYPDLTKHAEKRLAEIKPESAVLRVNEPVLTREMLAPERRQKLENDMNQWMNEMKLREKDLEEGKSMQIGESIPQPNIRQITFNENKKKQQTLKNPNKNKRISSCDYAAWDKYDADTELNRIELQHEKKQADIKRIQQKHREKEEKVKKTSRQAIVNNLTLTGTEYNVMAEEERKKGNEAFKAGDYEEALQFYDLSIAIDASTEAYNNRAITYIKLRRYSDAVIDCNRVISAEHMNIKALLRRALALEHLEKNSQALVDYEAILKLEPMNKVAIAAINKLRAPCSSKKIKMKIEEEISTEETGVMKKSEVEKIGNNYSHQEKSKSGQEKSKEKSNNCINKDPTTLHKSTTFPSQSSTSSEKSSQQIPPQVCFCNNAPSSSQHISPFPHMRNIYCSKKLEKSSGFPKLQSIFTNTKMSSDKSSGVIIEEIPNEPLEEPVEKSSNKKTNEKIKKNEEKNSRTILGHDDTPNKITKKATVLIEEIQKKEVELKEDIPKKKVQPQEDIPKKEIKLKENIPKMEVQPQEDIPKKEIKLKEDIPKMEFQPQEDIPKKEIKRKEDIRKKEVKLKEDIPQKEIKLKEDITMDINFAKISTPYEFLKVWHSLKNDTELILRAKLLLSLTPENINTGNKMDGDMLSIILRCFYTHFCIPEQSKILHQFLQNLTKVKRFSMICMFMNEQDKKVLSDILLFLEAQGSDPKILQDIRKAYGISM